MDSLSALLLLALLSLGQATSVTTVTQTPRTDQEVIREAVTDGFIVDQGLLTSLTTQAPQNTTRIPELFEEGSAMGEPLDDGPEEELPVTMTSQPTTTSEPLSSTSALSDPSSTPMQSDMSLEDSTLIESSGDQMLMTTPDDLLSTMSEQGSGEPATSQSIRPEGRMLINIQTEDKPVVVLSPQSQGTVTEMPKGHVTPDWIIIVGFLVGMAALVLVCVAIATRDRWNGPNQFNSTGVTLTPANQQSELEMEEFLHKKHPRENGKADEYTVIPLDELPDSYSS
ncbi:hypothetical protein NL108_008331 [Boleophthalmus pectinirostris]|uniref:uncharacterized protein LOC110162592 n=1 Tax=Boleophthalmus pectinirostris TaxID=150288 RepID=UPI000A1C5DE0|nr:uncharacterized protein LOC110162592 [Boleophthalmus pectinirostris]KAJ0056481.1 hypothetical protein NL108_008331 [Boleophthalmus pectinirostris]